MENFMKSPCKSCPYRRDVKPYLRPERGTELAYLPQNPYNDFFCHKTIEHGEDEYGHEDTYVGEDSLLCAGFLTLRAQDGEEIPEGFEPAWDICYTDAYEMSNAYDPDNE